MVLLHQIVSWITQTVGHWGYPGIVLLMALESSFFPFPSEVVIPPAGYLASTGAMNFWMVLVAGTAGSLLGAIFNYWLSMKYGRPFFEKYGRYLLISEAALQKTDRFFADHGHISTFTGRLLPGIRQYISLPAGLARMNFFQFCVFTLLGAGIWVAVLALLGYWVGQNQAALLGHLRWINIGLIVLCVGLLIAYIRKFNNRKASRQTD